MSVKSDLEIAQAYTPKPITEIAAAAGIDAIFCEVHPDPAKALSDGPNSLDFETAEKILTKVKAIHDLC